MHTTATIRTAALLVVAISACGRPADRSTELTGHVVDPSGRAIAGAAIRVWSAGPAPIGPGPLESAAAPMAVALTGEDGRFEVGGIDARRAARVEVRARDAASRWVELPAAGGDLTIELGPAREIAGVVLDPSGGPAAALVRVAAAPGGLAMGEAMAETRTDARGRFRLRDAPAGAVTVTAVASDLAPGLLELGPGQTGGTLRLERGGSLAGRVLLGGRPAVGAWVSVGPRLVRTASDGSYRIDGVEPRATRIEAISARGAGLAVATGTVQVGRTTRVDLALARTASVTGRVIEAGSGRPIAGARVRSLRLVQGGDTGSATALVRDSALGQMESWTGPDGRFALDRQRRGRTVLVVDKAGFSSRSSPIELKGGDPSWLEPQLTPLARVAGRVVGPGGAPMAGARISSGDGQVTTSGAGGWFAVAVAPDSPIRITARSRGQVGSAVVTGEDRTIELSLRPGSAIGGRVVSAAGEGLAGATVSARRIDEEPAGAVLAVQSGPDGALAFDELEAGSWELTAEKPGLATRILGPLRIDRPVRLDPLVLEPAHPVSGIVVAHDGSPVAGALVFAHGSAIDASAISDARGQFAIGGFAASESVTLEAVARGRGQARAVTSPGAPPPTLILGAVGGDAATGAPQLALDQSTATSTTGSSR